LTCSFQSEWVSCNDINERKNVNDHNNHNDLNNLNDLKNLDDFNNLNDLNDLSNLNDLNYLGKLNDLDNQSLTGNDDQHIMIVVQRQMGFFHTISWRELTTRAC
jgi:hypothetical protein